jgi:hypothetical protein
MAERERLFEPFTNMEIAKIPEILCCCFVIQGFARKCTR